MNTADAQRLNQVFDPFKDPYLADPYGFFANARTATPVFYSPLINYWVVTRYQDILQIFDTPRVFSASNALSPIQPPCPAARAILTEGGFSPVPTMTNVDPPAHTRVRRFANMGFKPRRIAEMEPFIRGLVVQFCEKLLARQQADLIKDFAWELPALVIFRVLGIPDEQVPRVKAGAVNRLQFMFGHSTEEEQCQFARETAAFWRYAEELVAARAAEPREDCTSDLLLARDGDQSALTHAEVASIVYDLLVAGHETTTNLLGNSFRRLLSDPSIWNQICGDPSLIPNAIEEVLRFDSSVITWRRKTTQAVEIGAVRVPADADLLLLLGSANRDPAVFEDPDKFDIHRANARDHLSFGHGAHFCLGAPLARFEVRIALEEISARIPSLRLVPGQTLRFLPNISFRGPLSLLAEWSS